MPTTRFLALALLAFLILAGYEAARPPVESLFLAAHGREGLPLAWLLVAGGAVAAVAAYNLAAARMALVPLLALCTGVSAVALWLLLLLADTDHPGHTWALYVWKDVYIIVLIEGFWTLANTTTPLKTARWAYGGLLAAGTLGALAGGTWAGRVAAATGLGATLELALPCLLATLGALILVARVLPQSQQARPDVHDLKADFRQHLATLGQSRYLIPLGLLILVTQGVTTLVDYAYNGVLASAFPDASERTVVISDIYRWVNVASLTLQLGGGFILALGLGRVFVGLPLVVGATVLGLALHPVFLVAAVAKVVGKSVDYSLFRGCKEMLYIPLSYAEQTQGKAVVDMLTYRVAKGAAALSLMGLVAVGAAGWSGWLAVGLVGAWVGLSMLIAQRYRGLMRPDTTPYPPAR